LTARRLVRGSLGFVFGRTFGAMLTVLSLSSLVFFALRLIPGDPAALVLGDDAASEVRAALRARLLLDQPLGLQYAHFLWGLVRLDLGASLSRPTVSAFAEVGAALMPTATLAFLAVALGATAGLAAALGSVGPWLGRGRSYVHGLIIAVASVPLLGFAPVLTWLVAVRLPLFPLPGDPDSGLGGLLFASGLLALPLGAQVARIARAALLDQATARYLDVARSKGASPLRVWMVHALPVACAPIAIVVATQLGALLGGAVVLERLFERPGLGTLMLRAHAARDLPVLEASVTAAGLLFVVAQLLAAVVITTVDPRGRTS
jgi:peptide/nickel transport system permease protein